MEKCHLKSSSREIVGASQKKESKNKTAQGVEWEVTNVFPSDSVLARRTTAKRNTEA